MNQRAVLLALALSVGLLVTVASAQQPASPRRIGVVLGGFLPEGKEAQQFRQGLRDAGYTEGRDVVIEWRPTRGDYSRIPELVADLLQRKVEVIVVDSTVATQAAKRATSTIPIVMADIADPVGSGLVRSLAHPGGNVTGLTIMMPELGVKRLELLKETIPQLTRVGVLWNPDAAYHPEVIKQLKAVAPSLALELKLVSARTPQELDTAFSTLSRERAQAVYVIEDTLFFAHRAMLLKRASSASLPTMHGLAPWVHAGALVSYGPNFSDMFRRAAGYVDKILRGTQPGDLPIEQPTKFELVVNLNTAKAIGITIPESILLRANEVIR
jgi:putative ABC transport system substrate-binding protein